MTRQSPTAARNRSRSPGTALCSERSSNVSPSQVCACVCADMYVYVYLCECVSVRIQCSLLTTDCISEWQHVDRQMAIRVCLVAVTADYCGVGMMRTL